MLKEVFDAKPILNKKEEKKQPRPRLVRVRKQVKHQAPVKEFSYLSSTDSRMRFNSAKDPIYFAFEYLENRSVGQLIGDFVKDSFFEITNFISKVKTTACL